MNTSPFLMKQVFSLLLPLSETQKAEPALFHFQSGWHGCVIQNWSLGMWPTCDSYLLPLEFAVLPRHIHLRYRSTAEMATLQFDLMQWCWESSNSTRARTGTCCYSENPCFSLTKAAHINSVYSRLHPKIDVKERLKKQGVSCRTYESLLCGCR